MLPRSPGRSRPGRRTGWADRFGLPYPPGDTGYGHSSEQVAAVPGPG